MRTALLFFIITILSFSSNAQSPPFEWAVGMGDANYQYGYALANDTSNNVYVTGYYQGTVDFDPGTGVSNLTSAGGYDVFIVKLDASGNFVWAKSVGGTSGDRGFGIASDNSGNVYVTGRFGGTVDFDPNAGTFNLTSAGTDAFVLKLNTNGDFVWAAQLSGSGSEYGRGITVDGSANVYVTGQFTNTVDFDPGIGTFNLTSAGNDDIFINKLDASGNFVWAKRMGSTGADRGYHIAFDGSTGLYATGIFMNTVDFDPNAGTTDVTSNGGTDIFIQKLDANGNFQWAGNMGGPGNDYGHGVATDSSGNVVSTGYFQVTADFDPGAGTTNLVSNGSTELFVQKLDPNGTPIWAKGIGGTSAEVGNSITTDAAGNVYTTGFFYSSVDFDPGASTTTFTSQGIADAFILKLDGNGDFSWAAQFGGAGYNEGRSVNIGTDGAVYSAGQFQQTVDFDHTTGVFNLSSAGNNDIFIHKMSACTATTGTDVISACDSYTWIDGITYTSSTNTPTFALTNASGCDSIVTLNLTINNSDAVTDVVSACDSYIWIDGITYTSSTNAPTQTLTNAAGCDSVVTLNLTINNSNTGTDIITACDSYTWIDGITYTSSTNTPTHTLTNVAGCDSVVTLNLTINNSTTGTDVVTACDTYTWINGVTYTSSTNAPTHTLTNAAGCDSIVTLNLTINNSNSGADIITACDSYTWIDGITYTSSTSTPTHVLTNVNGCDSTVTLNLTINNSNTGTDLVTACDSYTWIDGTTYMSSTNTPTHVLTNVNGCDSTVTLNLTINNSSTGTDVITACDSYTWIDGITYTSSTNSPTNTLTNAIGCDSVVSLNLTINNSVNVTDFITVCDSYTWIDGITYTSSTNSPTQSLTTVAGCDSIITLNLTINNSNTGTDVITACDTYTWIDGITYTSSTNTPTHVLTNANGCDSTVTLNLTINNSNTGTDVITACDSYTWIDGITYTSSTNVPTHILTNINGCDSTVTLNLTITNSSTGTDVITACDSYTWIDGNTYTSSTSAPTHTLINTEGCDSIVTLNLTITNSTSATDVITACDSYTWIDGNTYTSSTNAPTVTLTNAAGCDSIVTLNLTINNSNTGTDVITACYAYTWIDGITYTSSTNTPTYTLSNVNGCDSVVTLNLTIETLDVSTMNNSPTLSADLSGASYQWIDCDNGNAIIVGETGQDFTATANGNYAVIIDDGNCVDTSACMTVDNVSIDELNQLMISVHPNPSTGVFNVSLPAGEFTITVLDAQGRELIVRNTNQSSLLIDLSTYERAVYFLKVENGSKRTAKRLIMQ
jgi:hypothetical protein